MNGKKCGSAVLTALQIMRMPLEKFQILLNKRRVHAFLEGADPDVWMDTFWQTVGLVQAARAALNMGEKL